jgi:hypothetical protein
MLAAIYPGAIGMSIVILSEAVFCPLMILHLWLWQIGWSKRNGRLAFAIAVAAGCIAGLAILARPSWLLFTPWLFAIGVLFGSQRMRHLVMFAGAMVGIVMVMSPWWVRNADVTGRFVLTTLQVGPSLYDGLHEGATGASDEGMAFMVQLAEEQRSLDAQKDRVASTFEFRLNQHSQRKAVMWVMEHPIDAVMLAIRKFQRTWSLWPNGGEVGSSILRVALTVGCLGILSLALIGSLSSWRGQAMLTEGIGMPRITLGFYWMPAAYFTLLHMIFVGSIRYREPALLVLTVVAGIGLDAVWRNWRRERSNESQ